MLGLTMLFGVSEKKKSNDVFFQIGFFDKSNFQFGFVVATVSAIITIYLIFQVDGFSYWQFLSMLFLILGLSSIIKNVRRIK
jgi:hypothetical protein